MADAVQVPHTALPVDWFGRANGLDSGQVHQSTLDREGRLWAATPCGLARYDGVRIKMFTSRNGLNCNGLRAVAFDNEGCVWVGSDVGIDI